MKVKTGRQYTKSTKLEAGSLKINNVDGHLDKLTLKKREREGHRLLISKMKGATILYMPRTPKE